MQRHRWLNSVEPISEMLLLSVHNILPRAGILWLSKAPVGKAVPRWSTSAATSSAADPHPWDLSDSDGEVPAAPPNPSESAGIVANASHNTNPCQWWSVYNADQKSKAKRFMLRQPCDILMVIRISLIASIVCLRVVEHVASKGWDYQAWRGSTGDDCKGLSGSRMQVGALDSISKIYEGAVAKALY